MPDGGLNCDNDAYLVKDEVPSSMVGTIAAFEAILLYTKRVWTKEEKQFLDRGAEFLMTRKLMLGSNSRHNASERESAKDWARLCFPRYYLYDVLRGLNALTLWAEKTGRDLPFEAVHEAVDSIQKQFPTGEVRIGRHSYEGAATILQNEIGDWIRRQPASFFPLLIRVSEIGSVSPFLSKQWSEVKNRISSMPELRELL